MVKRVLIFAVYTAACSSEIIRYNINHHCPGGTGGVFECGRLKIGRFMLLGENVQLIISNRMDSDIKLIISTTNFKKELNQIKIKVGFCPRLTIRGNIIKHITIEHANKECRVSFIMKNKKNTKSPYVRQDYIQYQCTMYLLK